MSQVSQENEVVKGKLAACPLALNTPLTAEVMEMMGGEILVTLILGNGSGQAYLRRQDRWNYSLHDELPLGVGHRLCDVPQKLGFAAPLPSLRVCGMEQSGHITRILLAASVLRPPFPEFELAGNAPYLQGLCHHHPLARHLPAAFGMR